MTCVLLIMGGAVLAYLGFMTAVLGAECAINVTPWQIMLFVCAVLMALGGIVDGVIYVAKLIRGRRGSATARGTHGLYTPPKRGSKAVIIPKRPTKTGAKGKK